MKIEIARNSDGDSYYLIVDGVVRIEAETFTVCDNVRDSLRGVRMADGEYTEADEIADAITERAKADAAYHGMGEYHE